MDSSAAILIADKLADLAVDAEGAAHMSDAQRLDVTRSLGLPICGDDEWDAAAARL